MGCAIHLSVVVIVSARSMEHKDSGMSSPRRLWDFVKGRKRIWVPPLVIGLVILAALVILNNLPNPIWGPYPFP